jgi:hypothetical protein
VCCACHKNAVPALFDTQRTTRTHTQVTHFQYCAWEKGRGHFVGPLFDDIPSLELLARSVGKWCLGLLLAALPWNLEIKDSLFE